MILNNMIQSQLEEIGFKKIGEKLQHLSIRIALDIGRLDKSVFENVSSPDLDDYLNNSELFLCLQICINTNNESRFAVYKCWKLTGKLTMQVPKSGETLFLNENELVTCIQAIVKL